jgi:hypothetical protein
MTISWWISPMKSTPTPNTVYNFQDTSGMQASRMSTTSCTAAAKESVQGKVSYGIPFADSVSVTLQASATQTQQSTVAKNYNMYSSQSYTFNTSTRCDDKVAATAQQMNIYLYPVLGQMVCPQDSPNCPDDCAPGTTPCPQLPLHIQYSGPDNTVHRSPTDGATLEWYQPPTEPGNLFSYPGSLGLLEAGRRSRWIS